MLVCLCCERTVAGSLARCTVTWLPNFLGWVDYHISLAMGLCPRARFPPRVELRKESRQTPTKGIQWDQQVSPDTGYSTGLTNSTRKSWAPYLLSINLLRLLLASPTNDIQNWLSKRLQRKESHLLSGGGNTPVCYVSGYCVLYCRLVRSIG